MDEEQEQTVDELPLNKQQIPNNKESDVQLSDISDEEEEEQEKDEHEDLPGYSKLCQCDRCYELSYYSSDDEDDLLLLSDDIQESPQEKQQ